MICQVSRGAEQDEANKGCGERLHHCLQQETACVEHMLCFSSAQTGFSQLEDSDVSVCVVLLSTHLNTLDVFKVTDSEMNRDEPPASQGTDFRYASVKTNQEVRSEKLRAGF